MTQEATLDDPTVADDSIPDEHDARPTPGTLPRRRALGAAAVGLLAAACRTAGEQQATGTSPAPASSPTGAGESGVGTGVTASGGAAPLRVTVDAGTEALPVPPPTATGPELEQVLLPVADTTSQPMPAVTEQPPMVVVTDPESNESTGGSTDGVMDEPKMDDGSDTSDPAPDPDPTMDPETDKDPGTDTGDNNDGVVAKPDGGGGGGISDEPPIDLPAGTGLVANRLSFGASPSLMADLQRVGPGGYVANQLAATGPDPQAEALLRGFGSLGRGRTKAAWDAAKNGGGNRLQLELAHATLLRSVYSRHQLYEMMCQLWADHFNVDLYADGRSRHLLADHQENVIRPNAMGSFRDLLIATAHSPAMLTYLDNDTSNANSRQGLNENYGRELLELHTLGIDDDGNQVYTEADVRAAAMAMTGWSKVTNRNANDYSAFLYRDDYHHTGDISLLNGAWTRGATTGKATGDSLLRFLATHPSTARHIARKLCRRFVSDNPPATLVESTAQVYLANDTELVPTLRHVLTSEAFAASSGQKFRRPGEYLAAVLRALGSEMATGPESDASKRLRDALRTLDNQPWTWSQPDGFPDTASHWLSTDGLTGRWQLAARLARNRINGITTDVGSLRAAAGGSTAIEVAAGLGVRLGLGNRPPEELQAIVAAAGVDPAEPAGQLEERQVADMAALLLSHPIFQTR